MAKWTTDFKEVRMNLGQYRRVLLNALRAENERAGQAWIKEAVDTTPIPTWSGASRATFQKLAHELGTSVPIGPIRSKTSRVGLGLATSAGSGVEENTGRSNFYVGFIYETDLRYLAYNEYNAAIAGRPPKPFSNNVRFTPYGFQVRAADLWKFYAKKAKLPNPYKYLHIRKL